MPRTTMEITMSEDLKQRLHALALREGKTAQEFIQEALYTYVEDMEDGRLADIALSEEGMKFILSEGVNGVGVDHRVFETRRKTA